MQTAQAGGVPLVLAKRAGGRCTFVWCVGQAVLWLHSGDALVVVPIWLCVLLAHVVCTGGEHIGRAIQVVAAFFAPRAVLQLDAVDAGPGVVVAQRVAPSFGAADAAAVAPRRVWMGQIVWAAQQVARLLLVNDLNGDAGGRSSAGRGGHAG